MPLLAEGALLMNEYGATLHTLRGGATTAVLGVSIVNFYSAESIRLLLESLRRFSENMKIVVCILDNSDDLTGQEDHALSRIVQQVSAPSFDVSIMQAPRNLGYGAGNNLAVAYLLENEIDLIWVLNPDTKVRGSVIGMLEEVRSSHADIWATSTLERAEHTRGFGTLNSITGSGKTSKSHSPKKGMSRIDYPAGHSILFSRRAWTMLDGFDERYFLFMEEADMALRAYSLGLRIDSITSVMVEHDAGLTTGSTSDLLAKSCVAFREATKSRLVFFRIHFPARVPAVIFFRLAYAVMVLVRGNWRGALAVLQGLLSGMRKVPK